MASWRFSWTVSRCTHSIRSGKPVLRPSKTDARSPSIPSAGHFRAVTKERFVSLCKRFVREDKPLRAERIGHTAVCKPTHLRALARHPAVGVFPKRRNRRAAPVCSCYLFLFFYFKLVVVVRIASACGNAEFFERNQLLGASQPLCAAVVRNCFAQGNNFCAGAWPVDKLLLVPELSPELCFDSAGPSG